MNLPSPPNIRPDEFPDEDPKLLGIISVGFRDLFSSLVGVPDRVVRSGSFMSAASGVTTVSVKNPLSGKPGHITLSLRREDLADFSAAWSWWHQLDGDQVRLKFIALPASTRHVYTVEFIE